MPGVEIKVGTCTASAVITHDGQPEVSRSSLTPLPGSRATSCRQLTAVSGRCQVARTGLRCRNLGIAGGEEEPEISLGYREDRKGGVSGVEVELLSMEMPGNPVKILRLREGFAEFSRQTGVSPQAIAATVLNPWGFRSVGSAQQSHC